MDDWQHEIEVVYDLLIKDGYTEYDARELCLYKISMRDVKKRLNKQVTLRYQIPLELLCKDHKEFDDLTQEQKVNFLWHVGFDSKGYKFMIDIIPYSIGDKRGVGMVIIGQERTDLEWTTMDIDSRPVASFEAILAGRKGSDMVDFLRDVGYHGVD